LKATHQLKLLEREISVVSSAPAEKVRAVEVFVNERLQQISSALNRHDQELVLMLALLNISEELLDAKKNCSETAVVDKRVRGLLEKLHAV